MQATSTVKRVLGNEVRLAAFVATLLGLLTIAAVIAVITWNNDASPNVQQRSMTEPMTTANLRFLELNGLPVAPIPEPAVTSADVRFLELNGLPAAPLAPLPSFERMRFAEINALPGDDAPIVAPSSDQRGVPY